MSKEQQFWDAARSGDLSVVKTLAADTTLNINWQESSQGYSPFNYACFEGRVSVVQFLLTLTNIDVNKPQNQGSTPFYIACQNGHNENRCEQAKLRAVHPSLVCLTKWPPASCAAHLSLWKGN